MNSWKVLVIDDEANKSDKSKKSRYKKYQKLTGEKYDSRGFDLSFAHDIDNARMLLKKQSIGNTYDIVLLDVRLKKWGDDSQGTNFKELLAEASKQNLVALISAYWDRTSMVLVRDFLLNNLNIDQPLFFTFSDFESGGLAAVSTQIVTFIRRKRSLHKLEIEPKSPLRILHLSDLHFGSEGASKTLASDAKVNYLCDKIRGEWGTDPHLILVTGDIGNTGHPDDYHLALDWFEKVAAQFSISLPSPRFMLVPGNHDVSLPLAGAQQLVLEQDENNQKHLALIELNTQESQPLSIYANQPFKEFACKVSSTTGAWGSSHIGSWSEIGFAEYGVVFSGFNTSKRIDSNSWPIRAIDDDDIDRVIKKINDDGFSDFDTGTLHISITHHSPVGYPRVREEVLSGEIYMDRFLNSELAPRLLLHGHQHKRWGALPDGNKYMVIGAPAPSDIGQPNETPRGVNMISLEREGTRISKISAKSLVFSEPGWKLADLPNTNEFELDKKY